MALPLSPQVFAITAHLIEERAGLHYDVANIDLLADRLSERATELGFDSLLDYYYFIRYDDRGGAELSALIEALVVHETYFFREPEPLRVLVDVLVPELLASRSSVRLWSAACATGEEPYTLAMMLDHAALLDRVEIVASDVSERALARARAGVYGRRSLRTSHIVPRPGQLLEEEEGGRLRLRDDLRARVKWRCVNLMDREAVAELGVFDVVLCRNVLIYFADENVARVAGNLATVLARDGWLLVGASESLLRFGTIFECQERGGAFFYRLPKA